MMTLIIHLLDWSMTYTAVSLVHPHVEGTDTHGPFGTYWSLGMGAYFVVVA